LYEPRTPSEAEIAKYLEGNWQEDLLYVPKQEQQGYEFCQQRMAEMRWAARAVSPADGGLQPRD